MKRRQNENMKQLKEAEITICMATFPERFSIIEKTISSLLNQSISPTKILIHVNEADSCPLTISDSRIEFHYSLKENITDVGKFKMSQTVKTGYVLTVDDDIIYPNDYIETHIKWLKRFNNKVITGVHGASFPLDSRISTWQEYMRKRKVYHFSKGFDSPIAVQIIGTGTMAYCADTYKFNYREMYYQKMADIFIAVFAQKNKIPMVLLPRRDKWLSPIIQESKDLKTIWDFVNVDFDLQNKMIEVINTIDGWQINNIQKDEYAIKS